jgi:histidine ammonia-lyase
LIAVRQGVWLRCRLEPERALPAPLAQMLEELGQDIAPVREDRRLDGDLRLLIERMHEQHWKLYQ